MRKALHQEHRSKASILAETFRRTGRVFQAGTQRRNLPNFAFAMDLARRGKLGKLQDPSTPIRPAWAPSAAAGRPPKPSRPRREVDWDLYLGPAAWRPFNRNSLLDGFNFEKGGGLVGGGVLEWGSHCVDLCQWANDADHTVARGIQPGGQTRSTARYANGVKLVMRNDGWLPACGSCPVRFEGETGWVETGDSGESDPQHAGLAGRDEGGKRSVAIRPRFHVRNFLDCVKSRGQPRANADVACHSHIACHAANIAIFLNRKLTFDPMKYEFIGDEEANRLRSEALREPWHV